MAISEMSYNMRFNSQTIGYEIFEKLNILNKHAPQKKRLARANDQPFMCYELYKTIMVKSRL